MSTAFPTRLRKGCVEQIVTDMVSQGAFHKPAAADI